MVAMKRIGSKRGYAAGIQPVLILALLLVFWSGCSKRGAVVSDTADNVVSESVQSQPTDTVADRTSIYKFIGSKKADQAQYMKIQPLIQAAEQRAPAERTAEDYLLLTVQKQQVGDFPSVVSLAQAGLDLKPKDRKLKGHLFYMRGWAQVETENYKKAKGSLQNAMLILPDFEPAILQMGLIYLHHENNLGQAKTYFEMGLRRNPNRIDYLNGLGQVYQAQGDWAKAEEKYRGALQLHPGSTIALTALGELYVKQNKYDQAEKTLHHPALANKGSAHYQFGVIYSTVKNNPQKAEEHLATAVRLEPDNPEYHVALAKIYRTQNPEKALKHLQVAVQIKTDSGIFIEIAKFYKDGKEYQESMEYLNKAAEMEPENPEVYSEKGLLLILQKKHKKARAEFEKAVGLNPKDRWASYYLELMNIDPKDPAMKEQSQWAQKILENPADPEPHYSLGMNYLKNKKYDQALWEAETVKQLAPQQVKGRSFLAEVYLAKRDYPAVEEEMHWLLQRDPRDERALQIADGYYERAMKFKEWEKFYRKTYSSKKDALNLHYSLSKVYSSAEDYNRLIDNYLKLTELETSKSKNAENYFLLAELYAEKDDRKYAALTIKRGLRSDPENEFLKEKLEEFKKPLGTPDYMEGMPREFIRNLIVPSSRQWTKLHTSAANGKFKKVKRLVERGAEIDARNSAGLTPLHEAVKRDQLEIVKYLIENGAKVDAIVPDIDFQPIHYAASHKRLEVADYLISKGADVDARNNEGDTPLIAAARIPRNEDLRMIKLLVKNGAKITAINSAGCQAICYAAEQENLPLIEFLFSKGADLNFKAPNGATPLVYAILSGNSDIVEFMLDNGADPTITYKGANLLKLAKKLKLNAAGNKKRIMALLKRSM